MAPGAEAVLLRHLTRLHAAARSSYTEGQYAEAAASVEPLCRRSAALRPSHPCHLNRLAELGEFLYLWGGFSAARSVHAGLVGQKRSAGPATRSSRSCWQRSCWPDTRSRGARPANLVRADVLSREAPGIHAATLGRRDAGPAVVLINPGQIHIEEGSLPPAGRVPAQAAARHALAREPPF